MEEVDEQILDSLAGLGCSLDRSTAGIAALTPQQILRNRYQLYGFCLRKCIK
jgi:hypothetical protein